MFATPNIEEVLRVSTSSPFLLCGVLFLSYV